jgi:hypothetical protein
VCKDRLISVRYDRLVSRAPAGQDVIISQLHLEIRLGNFQRILVSLLGTEESEMIFQKLKVDRNRQKVKIVINRCEIYKSVRDL